MVEIPTRWQKILKDMWSNKTRTLLVVLSIAVGVAAIGMIRIGQEVIERDLYGPFQETNPHSISLYISPFDDDLARNVEGMREVKDAQARRTVAAFVTDSSGEEWDFALEAVPDFNNITVDTFEIEAGSGVPGVREILLERETAAELGYGIGDTVTVETSEEQTYDLTVIGIIHDLGKVPPFLFGQTYGYVSIETLAWMGQGSTYNRLDIVTAERPDDRDHVLDVVGVVRDRVLEPAGYHLGSTDWGGFTNKPRAFWSQDQINGITVVLSAMSVMSLLLSAGLVINTISAIINQQIKQIGILRSIGGRRRQINKMYFTSVLVFAVMALVIALPAGMAGGWVLAFYFADRLNFDLTQITLTPLTVAIQIVTGLIVPLAAAYFPVRAGTSISVYDAIYQHGLTGSGRNGLIDRQLNRIQSVTRPIAMAVRNTFRNKARLAFTLVTLTLAGAMFISVFSTRSSLEAQIEEIQRYSRFDVVIGVPPTVSRHMAEREALRVPGVAVAEGWAEARSVIVRPDGSEGSEVAIRSTPHDSITIEPLLVSGRWLRAGDGWHIVISEDVVDHEPGLQVGDMLDMKINGQTRAYEIVGIASRHVGESVAYMDYNQFGKVIGRDNPVSSIRIRVNPYGLGTRDQQTAVATALEEHFSDAGISDAEPMILPEMLDQISSAFDIILIFLLIMATLLSVVGGLGLAGTMSMNVMERTREIGVLRAVGASSKSVRGIVLIEGTVVGMTSWLLSVALSVPLGQGLSNAVGIAVFSDTIPYSYSYAGMIAWLVLAAVIGAVASLAPASRASRLTVRQVLAYE